MGKEPKQGVGTNIPIGDVRKHLWNSKKTAAFFHQHILVMASLPSSLHTPPSPTPHTTHQFSRHPEPAGRRSSLPRRQRHRRRGTCPCGSAPAGPRVCLREGEQAQDAAPKLVLFAPTSSDCSSAVIAVSQGPLVQKDLAIFPPIPSPGTHVCCSAGWHNHGDN